MAYDVPGFADDLSSELVERWNEVIVARYQQQNASLKSRFFALDPDTLEDPVTTPVTWFGDPAEPNFCMGPDVAQRLSDWGVRGRHELHNEYCEYRVIDRLDSSGRLRPKRVEVTTELPEYWACVARHDPVAVRSMARDVLGFEPAWEDLYGVSDPETLDERGRAIAFGRLVAGNTNDRDLVDAGVPAQPTGQLNTEHALFLTHPINGLDDLLYIVMFGARPYARRTESGFEPATREDIFRAEGVEQLACRHADPAAAIGAYTFAFEGRPVAFANPLGMYIHQFNDSVFTVEDEPIPERWIRLSRGQGPTYQRLEFGPGDEDPEFLDVITVSIGATSTPLIGGFQVAKQIEVGPVAAAAAPPPPGTPPVADDEYVVVEASPQPIVCREAAVCSDIRRLNDEFNALPVSRVGPRTMGRIG